LGELKKAGDALDTQITGGGGVLSNNEGGSDDSTGGGVLSNDEGSSESENTNPKNLGDNVLNDGSSDGSSESGGFDPDKVVGGGFNQ
jgi:hypothetical protein